MKQINIFFLVFTLVTTSTSADDQIQFYHLHIHSEMKIELLLKKF